MTGHALLLGAALSAAAPATAQESSRLYLGASVGQHAERSESIEGNTPAMAIVGGVQFARNWSAELELARPANHFTKERTCKCSSFSSVDFDRFAVTERLHHERHVLTSLTMGAVYHPALGGGWSPRLFLGATRHHVREIFSSSIVALGEGVDPARVADRSSAHTRVLGGPAFGAGVSYRLSRHVSLGTDVRYDYGSMGDEINNVWRTSVRSLWSF